MLNDTIEFLIEVSKDRTWLFDSMGNEITLSDSSSLLLEFIRKDMKMVTDVLNMSEKVVYAKNGRVKVLKDESKRFNKTVSR